jgi:metal-responsive CopG/Arc/MetJ family transcriptional regulator
MAEKRVTISLTMPPQLVKDVGKEAKKMGVTRSAFISMALSEFLRAINQPTDKEKA